MRAGAHCTPCWCHMAHDASEAVQEYLEGLGRGDIGARVLSAMPALSSDASTWVLELQAMELDGELDAFLDACAATPRPEETETSGTPAADASPEDLHSGAPGAPGAAVAGEVAESLEAPEAAVGSAGVAAEMATGSATVKGRQKPGDMRPQAAQRRGQREAVPRLTTDGSRNARTWPGRAQEDEAFDRLVGWLQHRRALKPRGQALGTQAGARRHANAAGGGDAGTGTGLAPSTKVAVEKDADAGPYSAHKTVRPEPEPEPEARPTLSLQLELEQPEATTALGELKFYVMTFNMECGDPTKWGCEFLPTDCDVYVIGLQEAGGENIDAVPPSPRPAPGPKKKLNTKEALYNMIEMHLGHFCGEHTHVALRSVSMFSHSCFACGVRLRAATPHRPDCLRRRAARS